MCGFVVFVGKEEEPIRADSKDCGHFLKLLRPTLHIRRTARGHEFCGSKEREHGLCRLHVRLGARLGRLFNWCVRTRPMSYPPWPGLNSMRCTHALKRYTPRSWPMTERSRHMSGKIRGHAVSPHATASAQSLPVRSSPPSAMRVTSRMVASLQRGWASHRGSLPRVGNRPWQNHQTRGYLSSHPADPRRPLGVDACA